jgi:hypothetical protein
MLKMMDGVKEGAGTLLDNSLVLATSESNFAKIHSVDNLPILVAGSAGGRWKQGQHISGNGDPSSRVGLTIQQVMGMPRHRMGRRRDEDEQADFGGHGMKRIGMNLLAAALLVAGLPAGASAQVPGCPGHFS